MKNALKITLVLLLLTNTFSCTHKRYAQKIVTISSTKESYFLFISDIHLDISVTKTDSTTDTGMDLWNSFKIKIDSILGSSTPPAFVLCTGDLPGHDNCDGKCYLTGNEAEKHNNELRMTLTDMRNLVSKYNIPLLFIPGNNDAVPGDYYSFTSDKRQTPFSLIPNLQNPYPAVNISDTSTNAPYILSKTHLSMGYYSALVLPGLRVIAMNSVIFANKYKPLDSIEQIAAGNEEMHWLSKQLNDAKAKGEKVYIAMHIPPGADAYKVAHHKTPNTTWADLPSAEHSWLKTFLSLSNDYHSTIAGIFFGHTHMDELRLLYDTTGNHVTEVAISAPGLSPQHGNNPGFKTVNFNWESKAITDFTTYYTTLPFLGYWGNNSYSFSDVFNSRPKMSIYDFINSKTSSEINKSMDSFYTVMHGAPKYNTQNGMIVK